MSDADDLRIRPDIKRLAGIVTVDQYFALRDNDLVAEIEVLSQFIIGENGEYLDQEEGRRRLGTLKITEIVSLFSKFMTETEEIAVPLASGKISASP